MLHEVNIAKVIAAKEMVFTKEIVFNIGLFPIELLVELILCAARTQPCAGGGELIFGLTNHGPMLPQPSPGCQYAVFGGFGRLRLGLLEIHPVRLIEFPKGFQRALFLFLRLAGLANFGQRRRRGIFVASNLNLRAH